MRRIAWILVLALGPGCAKPKPQTLRGASEIVEIRLNGDVVVGFAWIDPQLGLRRRFATFREGDRLILRFEGLVLDAQVTLADVVPDRVLPFWIWACPDSRKRCPGPWQMPSFYAVGEITYETESRWRRTIRLPSDPPKIRDLCHRHGGSRPGPEKVKPPAPPATEEELAWILYQANYDWGSRNPKIRLRAREAYRLLIENHRDSLTVIRSLSKVADRADTEVEE